jgi:polysaccharide biosynthesis/export protein
MGYHQAALKMASGRGAVLNCTLWFFAAAYIAAAAAGQSPVLGAAARDADHSQAAPTLQTRPRYQIEPGDVMDLSFPLSPEYNQTVTVAPDGYVALRGVGDLSVANKSLPEVRSALRSAYSEILHDPVINVDLKDFQKPYFTVGGQVAHPGKFELRQDVTVTEAIAIAGGATTSAKNTQVLLFHHLPGGSMVEVRKLDLKKMMKKRDLSEDAHLQPGDLLFVPQNAISKIERFLPTSSLGVYSPSFP